MSGEYDGTLDLNESRPQPQPDFFVHDEGSVWLFIPASAQGAEFALTKVHVEDWQYLGGGSFAADHRPARALVEAMEDEGLIVVFK
jgi:hypothetical protein